MAAKAVGGPASAPAPGELAQVPGGHSGRRRTPPRATAIRGTQPTRHALSSPCSYCLPGLDGRGLALVEFIGEDANPEQQRRRVDAGAHLVELGGHRLRWSVDDFQETPLEL